MINDVEHFFMCLLAIHISSLEKYVFRYSAHILIVFFFNIELYELIIYFGYYPLSVISFENIFFYSAACLFNLSVVSFALQKLLSLIKSHLFIFGSVSFILGDHQTTLLQFMSKSVLPMFSPRAL